MENTNRNYSFAAGLAHGLVSAGVRNVCISPGSRNTPLALTLGGHPQLRDWVIHDERTAGFFALGAAKATRAPVVVVATSGTAGAQYFPAVIEARTAGVPLVILTADRPPELRNQGAPQTIDQVKLFGDGVKWFHDAGVPDRGSIAAAAPLGVRLVAEATGSPPGPVHLNVPMRDPLAPIADELGMPETTAAPPMAVHGAPEAPSEQLAPIAERLTGKRALIVAGHDDDPRYPAAVAALAAALQAPVLADPLSGLRTGPHDHRFIVTAPDLLAGAGMLDRAPPEVIVRLGALPTEKTVWTWLEARPDVFQVAVDGRGWRDPLGSASVIVTGSPAAAATALSGIVEPSGGDWASMWMSADAAVAGAIGTVVEDAARPQEPVIARRVAAAAPSDSIVFAASSMPVRDLGFLPLETSHRVRILANRGANGIDGSIAAALGAAVAAPTTLLVGDVAALHDIGSLRTAALLQLPLRIVVIHNDGGGIFHHLPQSDPRVVSTEDFERYLATPHGTYFVAVAHAMGLDAVRAQSMSELDAWLADPGGGPRLVEIRTDRRESYAFRERVRAAARDALDGR